MQSLLIDHKMTAEFLDRDNNLHESQGDSSKEFLDDRDILHLVS